MTWDGLTCKLGLENIFDGFRRVRLVKTWSC